MGTARARHGQGKARLAHGARQGQGHSSLHEGESVSLLQKGGVQTLSLYRIESMFSRYRKERDVKAQHGKPRQSKASLAMSCLALPGGSLLSIERITRLISSHLISSIERRREGKA